MVPVISLWVEIVMPFLFCSQSNDYVLRVHVFYLIQRFILHPKHFEFPSINPSVSEKAEINTEPRVFTLQIHPLYQTHTHSTVPPRIGLYLWEPACWSGSAFSTLALFFSPTGQCSRHHHGRWAGVRHPAQHHRQAAVWPGRVDVIGPMLTVAGINMIHSLWLYGVMNKTEKITFVHCRVYVIPFS